MLRNRKAQGLSLNTIIIAAIVLVVLVVLFLIFTGRMGSFAVGVDNTTKSRDCLSLGYYPVNEDSCNIGDRYFLPVEGLGPGQVCCKVPG